MVARRGVSLRAHDDLGAPTSFADQIEDTAVT
jgi:hypothetical protein